MIEFHCKNCGQKLSVQDQHSGKRVKCPKCSSVGVVPDNSEKIKFNCQNCGQSISVPQIYAGKKGKCPKCKNVIVIPTREAIPAKSTSMVSFTCSMCDEIVQVPETSIGKTIECPECGSYIETSPGDEQGEPDVSADKDLYEEETEEYEESEGLNKRIIIGISAVAAVVVVGLIVLAVVLRSSGPRPAEGPDGLPMQRQIADTDSRHQPVTPDTQPEEPVEAVSLPKPGDVVANSIGMKLVYIPAGSFMMGSSDSAAQLAREYGLEEKWFAPELPQHQVRMSKGFWMSKTEVTQGQYKSVMNAHPWSGEDSVQEDANNPAVYMSWDDATEFCVKLSQQEGRTYRLPREAEWEYACRAGTTTRFSFGDSDASLGDYVWFRGNLAKLSQRYAHPVGQKKPNPWRLYDMHGNVWEWCSDYYDKDYYSDSPSVDPEGPSSGDSGCLRGGSWGDAGILLRCSYRLKYPSVVRSSYVGFRVVCSDQEKTSREEVPNLLETSIDYFNRGKAYADKSQYDRAISDFNEAIEIDPMYAEAYNNRAIAYIAKGQFDQAFSDFNKAIEINPQYAEAYLYRGGLYDHKGEYDRAISDFNKAIEINPRYVEAYSNRGYACAKKGEYDQAISDCTKAIEIDPQHAAAYLNRGLAYDDKDQYDQAISDYNKAIELNSTLGEAYLNRGVAYLAKGQYDKAISDCNKAIEIYPQHAAAYLNRGLAYDYKGEYDQAISDYTKAIEINPRYDMAYSNRADVYLQKDEYDQAISDCNKAIEINPRNAGAYLNRAGVYVQKREFDKAISDCNKAVEINPEFSTAYHNRAAAYFLKGDYDEAWEDVHKAESLGDHIHPALLNALRKASGRQR